MSDLLADKYRRLLEALPANDPWHESRRIDANGGVKSQENYNKIESPGKKYRDQDGQ